MVFYVNVPVVLIAFGFGFAININVPSITWRERLHRLDFGGNLLFVTSSASILLGLAWGGFRFPWSAWRTFVPLCAHAVALGFDRSPRPHEDVHARVALGVIGLIAFLFYENKVPYEPTIPFRLFSNLNTILGFILALLLGIALMAVAYYLPFFLQGCWAENPLRAGIWQLYVVRRIFSLGLTFRLR